jgi:WD40 repeat protein
MLRINANQVATVSDDNLLVIWDINTSSLVNTYHAHTNKVQGVTLLPSGYLATCGNDQTIRVWDVENALLVATVNTSPTTGSNTGLEFKWSAATGLFVVSIVNYLTMFNPSTFALTNSVNTGKTYTGLDILQPNGRLIAVGQSYLLIYTLPSFTVFYTQTSAPSLTRVKLLPDNETAVLGCSTGQLMVFNTNTNAMGATYLTYASGDLVLLLVVTPDGVNVVSSAQDSNIKVWTWGFMSLTQVKSTASATTLNYGVIVSGVYTECKQNNFFFENNY